MGCLNLHRAPQLHPFSGLIQNWHISAVGVVDRSRVTGRAHPGREAEMPRSRSRGPGEDEIGPDRVRGETVGFAKLREGFDSLGAIVFPDELLP